MLARGNTLGVQRADDIMLASVQDAHRENVRHDPRFGLRREQRHAGHAGEPFAVQLGKLAALGGEFAVQPGQLHPPDGSHDVAHVVTPALPLHVELPAALSGETLFGVLFHGKQTPVARGFGHGLQDMAVALVGGLPWLLVLGLAALFGCLFFFKYAGLLGLGVTLPLAISFYSFQLAAYLIDVYRGRVTAETKPLLFFTGVLLFPKLLSGPLMDPLSLQQQLSAPPRPGLEDFDSGLRDFVLGLSMKVLLANQIGGLWRQVGNIGYESVSTPLAWMGIAAYSLQLYLDFCGYSWMALGLGRMLGFRLPRNFEHPYAARSMRDFWRRWHISLSSWFRDYVYIPLGGSREGKARTYLNLLAVWVLTGLWHGSTLNFLLWGLFLFVLIALERAGWDRVLDKSRVLSRVYMVLMIPLSWLLFAIPSVGRIGVYLGRLFPIVSRGVAVNAGDWLQYGKQYWWLLVLGIVFSTPGPEKLWNRIRSSWLGTVILAVLFWACVYCMSVATNDPFLYFSF